MVNFGDAAFQELAPRPCVFTVKIKIKIKIKRIQTFHKVAGFTV